jgi:hypothetical protein
VDDEVEHASKTALCNEIEGGTRGDEWEGEEEAVDTKMYGNTDSSNMTWRVTKHLLVGREKQIYPLYWPAYPKKIQVEVLGWSLWVL